MKVMLVNLVQVKTELWTYLFSEILFKVTNLTGIFYNTVYAIYYVAPLRFS